MSPPDSLSREALQVSTECAQRGSAILLEFRLIPDLSRNSEAEPVDQGDEMLDLAGDLVGIDDQRSHHLRQ